MGKWPRTMEGLEMTSVLPDFNFWNNKRILITGHTGFKGSWLTLWLHRMGAQVTGLSLRPNTAPNLFDEAKIYRLSQSLFCDIRNGELLDAHIKNVQPEIVFHLAAQPLVRHSYSSPLETYSTNVMGTANVLDAIRGVSSVKAAIMITTDKVYQNNEWLWPYRESDKLGGHDPYSASKAASEIIIASYREAFLTQQGVAVASARAGNVIGGGDWSADRLIPDAIRAWQKGEAISIRRPNAIRPWQHVLDSLAGYLVLAQSLFLNTSLTGAYNFGPWKQEPLTVRDVIELARTAYGHGSVEYGDGKEGPHEAGALELEITKTQKILGFQSQLSLAEAIQRTIVWYRSHNSGVDAQKLCEEDIAMYESLN